MRKTCIQYPWSSLTLPLLLFVMALLLTINTAQADNVAYSCHPKEHPGVKFTIRGGCVGFDAKDENGVTGHVDFGLHVSGDILVSDDGRHVVAIQSFFYGRVREDGSIVDYSAGGENIPTSDPVAVLIYRDRHFLASYRFSEILQRPTLVEQSVSHFSWLRNVSGFDESCGKKLLLDTTSFRHLEFDLDTGRMEKQDAPEWKDCNVIARPYAGKIEPENILKGDAKQATTFDNPRRLQIDTDDAVCLKHSPSGRLTAVSTVPMRWEPWLAEPAVACPR